MRNVSTETTRTHVATYIQMLNRGNTAAASRYRNDDLFEACGDFGRGQGAKPKLKGPSGRWMNEANAIAAWRELIG